MSEGKKNGKYPGFDDYEVEDAARALKRAEEVKQNSKLFAAAQKCLKKELKAIRSIADLKKVRDEKMAEKSDY